LNVERELILNKYGPLKFEQILPSQQGNKTTVMPELEGRPMNLDQVISKHIQEVLSKTNGKVHGAGGAAELLGINPSTLRNRMNKLGISYGRGK
jgi:hydrogenase-4 transcriptional activator